MTGEQQMCGQGAVITQGTDGHQTGPCIEPAGHGPHHMDADGNTWTESVRPVFGGVV